LEKGKETSNEDTLDDDNHRFIDAGQFIFG